MSKKLHRFIDKNEYDNYINNVPQLSRPQVCYCRDGRLVSYFPILLKIICDDKVVGKTYKCSATANGIKRDALSWSIIDGKEYAAISQEGLITISVSQTPDNGQRGGGAGSD